MMMTVMVMVMVMVMVRMKIIVILIDWWRGDVSTCGAPLAHSFGRLWLRLNVNDDDDEEEEEEDDDYGDEDDAVQIVQWNHDRVRESSVQVSIVQCSILNYSIVQCSILQFSIMQCSNMQRSFMQRLVFALSQPVWTDSTQRGDCPILYSTLLE